MPMQTEFTGGELTPALYAKPTAPIFGKGLKTCRNFIVLPSGGVANRSGTVYVAPTKYPHQVSRLEAFEFATDDTVVLEFGDNYVRFIVHDPVTHKSGYVETIPGSGIPYEVVSPYPSEVTLALRLQQIGDVVTIVHPDFAPSELVRNSRANNDWSLDEIVWQGNILPAPDIYDIDNNVGNTGTWHYAVTAVTAEGTESLPDKYATAGVTLWEAGDRIVVKWHSVEATERYNIYLSRSGVYGRIGQFVVDSGADLPGVDHEFVDINITPDYVTGGPPVARRLFPENNDKHPQALAVHNLRMVYGGTRDEPNQVWGTRPGNFYDLSTNDPITADSAFEWFLASDKLDQVQHLFSWRRQILLFTSGGVWVAKGDNGELSATNFQLEPNLGIESSNLNPIIIDDNILFVGRNRDVVYDMNYSFDANGYHAVDRSIHASHLLSDQNIIQWAYQRRPFSIVWAVTDKGALLGLTYLPSAGGEGSGVWAWHRHDTSGFFESVTVVKEDNEDAVYFVVRRLIDGALIRYVERMQHRKILGNVLSDGIFMDSAATTPLLPGPLPSAQSDTPMIVSGLDHLEGREVTVIADADIPPGIFIVENGEITLPWQAQNVFVGLRYVSELAPLNYRGDATSQGYRSAQGSSKRPVRVSLYVYQSRGFKVGSVRGEKMYNTPMLNVLPDEYGLYTGDVRMSIGANWEPWAGTLIRHEDPTPISILSISPIYEMGS